MEKTALLKRVSEHLAEVIGLLSMGVAVVGATVGIEWILIVGAVGFIVGTPLALLLGPDYETTAERNGDVTEKSTQEDPLETVKAQYAEGTLSEGEFERKVGHLLAVNGDEPSDAMTRESSTIEATDRDTGAAGLKEKRLD